MINNLIIELLQVNINTGISANVTDGNAEGVRVYHRIIPQGADFGCIAYSVLDETPEHAKQGRKVDEFSVSFTCRHLSDLQAKTIAYNLRTVLETWQGVDQYGDVWYRTNFDRITEGYEETHNLHTVVVDFTFSKPVA